MNTDALPPCPVCGEKMFVSYRGDFSCRRVSASGVPIPHCYHMGEYDYRALCALVAKGREAIATLENFKKALGVVPYKEKQT